AHAASAVLNFTENCTPEILTRYLDGLVSKLLVLLQMTGKKVKLLDLENEQVAKGIVMSVDPKKIVMGRSIGHVYCEVSMNYANKPDAPLFVKDDQRFRIKDAIGSHILWIRDYVLVDEAKQSLFSG
ncbi:hypothetical protein Taro_054230, partial [Colocasia esculenta]|nr:hypothetical protein [Colocasia esculenta]